MRAQHLTPFHRRSTPRRPRSSSTPLLQPVEKKTTAKDGEEGADAKPKKAAAITFIADSKRSQNMGIAVSNFKKLEGFKAHGWRFVRDALTDMRMDDILGQDGIDVLVQWKPEPAEKERCKELKEDEIPRLAFSESFIFEIAKVGRGAAWGGATAAAPSTTHLVVRPSAPPLLSRGAGAAPRAPAREHGGARQARRRLSHGHQDARGLCACGPGGPHVAPPRRVPR